LIRRKHQKQQQQQQQLQLCLVVGKFVCLNLTPAKYWMLATFPQAGCQWEDFG
jgi:hypothetical protein